MTRRNFLEAMLGVITCAAIPVRKITTSKPSMNRSKRIEKLQAKRMNSWDSYHRYVAINSNRQERYEKWLNENLFQLF